MDRGNVAVVFLLAVVASSCQSSQPLSPAGQAIPLATGTTVEIVAPDCEEGLRAVVEATLIKNLRLRISPTQPDYRLTLSSNWQLSGPGTTSFYSSWGNADLTVRLERVSDGATVLADSFTEGAKSRALAMKKASEDLVVALRTRLRPVSDK